MREHGAEVMHLASPFVLGWRGLAAAEALGIPSVAVYQTDIPSYAERYGVPGAAPALTRHLGRLHRRADAHPRAVELGASSGSEPPASTTTGCASGAAASTPSGSRPADAANGGGAASAEPGEVIVGYVGRLAPEKQVEDLRALAELPAHPPRHHRRRARRGRCSSGCCPAARFTGFLGGDALAEAMASLDVFVHPGESETFCQTIQEALASGVPVVATGRGGPLDLVRSSVDGWLYRPGDLAEFREPRARPRGRRRQATRVRDACPARRARTRMGRARRRAHRPLRGRARRARRRSGRRSHAGLDRRAASATEPERPTDLVAVAPAGSSGGRSDAHTGATIGAASGTRSARPRWRRYVAVGDSLTEGLCDVSRMQAGEYRGWADRLAIAARARQPRGRTRRLRQRRRAQPQGRRRGRRAAAARRRPGRRPRQRAHRRERPGRRPSGCRGARRAARRLPSARCARPAPTCCS